MSFQAPESSNEQPTLCKTGCGFFASSSGMCSKCFRESQAKQEAAVEAKSHAHQQHASAAVPELAPPVVEAASEPQSSMSSAAVIDSAPAAAPVSKTRCQVCRKKVGLTGFKCKCSPDAVFCGQHRYAEAHDCCFDYKAAAAKKIAAANPLVQAAKVEKI